MHTRYGGDEAKVSIVSGDVIDGSLSRRVHARAAEHRAVVDISTGIITLGSLTARQAGLVRDWVELHRGELLEAWQRASGGDPPGTIDPLP